MVRQMPWHLHSTCVHLLYLLSRRLRVCAALALAVAGYSTGVVAGSPRHAHKNRTPILFTIATLHMQQATALDFGLLVERYLQRNLLASYKRIDDVHAHAESDESEPVALKACNNAHRALDQPMAHHCLCMASPLFLPPLRTAQGASHSGLKSVEACGWVSGLGLFGV